MHLMHLQAYLSFTTILRFLITHTSKRSLAVINKLSSNYISSITKHFIMKKNILYAFSFALLTFLHYSCQKEIPASGKETSSAIAARNSDQGHLQQTNTFSSDVAIKWMNMQVWQMYKYPGIIGNVAYSRHYAYSGIALYEAVVPGMPAYQSIASQLNGLTGLPKTKPGAGYHWAASANAASLTRDPR